MNENTKTFVFVACAGVALAAVVGLSALTRSWTPEPSPEAEVGKPLFKEFDALAINSMKILKFDEGTGTATPFEVSQVNNIWSIPSHENYPADAEKQLADVAEAVMDRNVLTVEPDAGPGSHADYGVVDPNPKTLEAGAEGVGTRITMQGEDATLLDLIIGAEVPDRPGLRYVRRAGQDRVYTVEIDPSKVSTKFEDWIEEDLLKLSSLDIKQVEIRDHSVDEVNGVIDYESEMVLGYDSTGDPKWTMLVDRDWQAEGWTPITMAEDEELDEDVLGDLTRALDDLKIVDVQRKPTGLSGDLKTVEGLTIDQEGFASLMSKGFFLQDGELISNEGDIRCLVDGGVEYVLRFGNLAGSTSASTAEEGSEGGGDADTSDADVNRYIFVMAQFNPEAIPKPELEELPQVPAEGEATPGEATPSEGDAAEGETPDDTSVDDAKAERERIEKENQREQDEYDDKVAEGKKRVDELNARFADWYYVISDEVYKKIHVSRDQIVKKKEAETDSEAGGTEGLSHPGGFDAMPPMQPPTGPLGEFRNLEQEGPGSEEPGSGD